MTDISIAEQVLEAWGATAQPLPTSTKDESDWLSELEGCRLLIEEKTKFDNPVLQLNRHSAFAAGEVHASTVPLVRNNRLSGIVRKAAKQLSSTGADLTHDLRVVWFTGVGFDAEAKHLQFIATLYGSTQIFELDGRGLRPYYFFRNSDFFRFRDQLDGAIVAYLSGNTVTMKLCLNPYSGNYQMLRDSPFARKFPTGLVDPVAEEAAGEALIADTDIDRSNESAVIDYLQLKYKLERAMNMDMNMASAAFIVPK